MVPSSRRAPRGAALLAAAAFALVACAGPAETEPTAPPAHDVDAGGAAEVAAPARALVVAGEHSALTLVDLDTEERTVLDGADALEDAPVQSVFGDGRRVYVARAAGARTAVEIIDTGRWTVPHGDHTHSFLADPRQVGTVDGEGRADVRSGDSRTIVRFDGTGPVLLEADALAGESFEAPDPLAGAESARLAQPFADHLLVATDASSLEIRAADGTPTPAEPVACAEPADVDLTRVGAVFSCAEGAVLFTREVGGALAVESIPLPAAAAPPRDLSGRADRPDLAGVAGEQGAWLLDVRQREWMLLPTDVPLLRVAAIGDDAGRTVAIDLDGCVRVLGSDGAVLARTEPLLAASVTDSALRERVHLAVDAHHAYVTDPATGAVHEIAHDDGRVTRTFPDLDPWFLQQVG